METRRAATLPARLLCALAAAWLPAVAQAGLWGFVDGAGVAHFASEPVDSRYQLLHGDDAAGRRVPGKTDAATSLLTWLDIAPEVKAVTPLLREAEKAHGVDAELLKAVIAVESGFKADAVSPRGAIGLMQITPGTADAHATAAELKVPAEQRLREPRTNILTGARVLKRLLERFGSTELALAAWNAGEGRVLKAGGKMPPIAETRAHVHLTLELYWALLQSSQARRAKTATIQGQ